MTEVDLSAMFTPGKKSIAEYLASVNLSHMVGQFQDLGIYLHEQLKYLGFTDVQGMQMTHVQRRMVHAEILKLQTPVSKKIVEEDYVPQHAKSRKTLFGNEPENEKDTGFDDQDTDEEFTYKSPIEMVISTMKEEIDVIEIEKESADQFLIDLQQKYPTMPRSTKSQCSHCHVRGDHNRRQCQLDECVSAQQCGELQKHPEEKQELGDASDQLKKLERDLKSKRAILQSKLCAQESVKASFDHAIKNALINSNKEKYLFRTGKGAYVPKTAVIQIDTAILSKLFKNKVPSDLPRQARVFQTMIENFNGKHEMAKLHKTVNPMKAKLEESGINFPCSSTSTDRKITSCPVILPSPVYNNQAQSADERFTGQALQFIFSPSTGGVVPQMLPYTFYGTSSALGQSPQTAWPSTQGHPVQWNPQQMVQLNSATCTSDNIQGVSCPTRLVDYPAASRPYTQSVDLQLVHSSKQKATDAAPETLPPKKRKSTKMLQIDEIN